MSITFNSISQTGSIQFVIKELVILKFKARGLILSKRICF